METFELKPALTINHSKGNFKVYEKDFYTSRVLEVINFEDAVKWHNAEKFCSRITFQRRKKQLEEIIKYGINILCLDKKELRTYLYGVEQAIGFPTSLYIYFY